MEEVNHVSKRTLYRYLTNIASFPPKDQGFGPYENVFHSLRLHPTLGFMWEHEIWEEQPSYGNEITPIGWGDDEGYYV